MSEKLSYEKDKEKSLTIKYDMMSLPGEELEEEDFTFSDPNFLKNEKTDLNFVDDFKVENPVEKMIGDSLATDKNIDEIYSLDTADAILDVPFMLTKFAANSNHVKELSISAIVENEDGVYQVAEGLKTDEDTLIDKNFLALVNSVIG